MGSGYERPGRGFYANAVGIMQHGDVCVARGVPGTAIKQEAYSYDSARGPGRAQIDAGERYFHRVKGVGEVEVGVGKQGVNVAAAASGDALWIADGSGADARNTVHAAAAAGRVKLGRVTDVPGIHGCPTGIIRFDMDLKDTF
jgi:hypothetical protein